MKNQEYSEDFLKRLRQLLPWGAQTKIAQKLSTLEIPVTVYDVHKVLHGAGLKYGKIPVPLIIKEAESICNEAKQITE